jgi:hypothetical protein
MKVIAYTSIICIISVYLTLWFTRIGVKTERIRSNSSEIKFVSIFFWIRNQREQCADTNTESQTMNYEYGSGRIE